MGGRCGGGEPPAVPPEEADNYTDLGIAKFDAKQVSLKLDDTERGNVAAKQGEIVQAMAIAEWAESQPAFQGWTPWVVMGPADCDGVG